MPFPTYLRRLRREARQYAYLCRLMVRVPSGEIPQMSNYPVHVYGLVDLQTAPYSAEFSAATLCASICETVGSKKLDRPVSATETSGTQIANSNPSRSPAGE